MWEKTVMSDEQIATTQGAIPPEVEDMSGEELFYLALRTVAQAQAEITGEIAYKEGIKKVVEFVDTHVCNPEEWEGWQEFKKENGLLPSEDD